MQYVLSLLPMLACPVGMGLMMWLMMRGNKKQATDQVHTSIYSKPLEVTNESPKGASMLRFATMCLNWKVVAGLTVVGLVVWIVAPQFIWVALPLLILAACPRSMLFMMPGMLSGGSQQPSELRPDNQSPAVGIRHDEQLSELPSRMSSL